MTEFKWHHNSLLNSFSLKRGRRRDREAEAKERKIWDRQAFCCSWILAIEISKSDVCHKNNDKSQAFNVIRTENEKENFYPALIMNSALLRHVNLYMVLGNPTAEKMKE